MVGPASIRIFLPPSTAFPVPKTSPSSSCSFPSLQEHNIKLLVNNCVVENLAGKVNPHLPVVDGQVCHREDVDLDNFFDFFATTLKSTDQAVSILKVGITISSQSSTFVLHQSDLRDLS